MIEHAYPAEDEIPVDLNIPELDGILAGKRQRGRVEATKTKLPKWLEHVPEEYRECTLQAIRAKGSVIAPTPVSVKKEELSS